MLFWGMKVLVATFILLLRLSTAAAAGNTTNGIDAELLAADPPLRKSVHQHAAYARILALAARASPPTPDKFTVHTYQTMYGAFLLPLALTAKAAARDVSFLRGGSSEPHFKVLEMGMGCHLPQGPGAAIHWWQKTFPMAERWFSEQDEDCVARARAAGQIPKHAHVLLADRGSRGALDRWMRQANGAFDVIIDSISQGGYKQTKAAFDGLWPTLPPGGLYFMENLSVPGRWTATQAVAGMLQCYMEQLLVEAPTRLPADWPIPPDLSFVFCQDEACVVGKSSGAEVGAPATPSMRRARRALRPARRAPGARTASARCTTPPRARSPRPGSSPLKPTRRCTGPSSGRWWARGGASACWRSGRTVPPAFICGGGCSRGWTCGLGATLRSAPGSSQVGMHVRVE